MRETIIDIPDHEEMLQEPSVEELAGFETELTELAGSSQDRDDNRNNLLHSSGLSDKDLCPLSREEEVELARAIETGRFAEKELAENSHNPERASELECQIETGRKAVLDLFHHNLPYVLSFAKKCSHRRVEISDLFQEGSLGLMRAIDKFDYHLGFKFSSYARYWILEQMMKLIANQSRTIRLPVQKNEALRRFKRKLDRITQELGHKPTIDEMAESLGLTSEEVITLSNLKDQSKIISLDSRVGSDDDESLGDCIKDESALDPYEEACRIESRVVLNEVLSRLPYQGEQVLKMSVGWYDGEESLKDIARKMGVSGARVRKIRERALGKLRRPPYSRELKDLL